jgi:hypothetical protein
MRTSLLWIQPRLFVGVRVQLVFGLQESTYLQQLSQLHMDSNLGVLLLHGKINFETDPASCGYLIRVSHNH